MPVDHDTEGPRSVLDALLMPLRLPGRVISDVQTLAEAVLSLQRSVEQLLGSVDDRAGALVAGLGTLQQSVDRIETRIENLESLEVTIEGRMEALRGDLNTRMLAVEHEVQAMRPPMEQMSRGVAEIVELLPNPSDGPLARLKDTLTSSS